MTSFKGSILKNEWLSNWVYYRIGGPAKELLFPEDEADIIFALEESRKKNRKLFVLGSGTNLLVRDGGIAERVLYLGPKLSSKWHILKNKKEEVTLRVPSYYSKSELVLDSLRNSWSGLEFSAGIPGTLGGAVFMNAGTKWGSYADVIEKVRLYKVGQGLVELSKEEMGFKYRGHGEGILSEGAVVLSVDLKLQKAPKESIQAKIDEILKYRGSKQPLENPNCGSVFKNPSNSERGAGRLIEAAGLKGKRIGQAQISLKHANFILNLGGAKASDVESLIEFAQQKIFDKFQIKLETEVIIVGDK